MLNQRDGINSVQKPHPIASISSPSSMYVLVLGVSILTALKALICLLMSEIG